MCITYNAYGIFKNYLDLQNIGVLTDFVYQEATKNVWYLFSLQNSYCEFKHTLKLTELLNLLRITLFGAIKQSIKF